MKLYKLTFAAADGHTIRFRGSKIKSRQLVATYKNEYPLRAFVSIEPVEVPEYRDDFVDWLNALQGEEDEHDAPIPVAGLVAVGSLTASIEHWRSRGKSEDWLSSYARKWREVSADLNGENDDG